MTFWNLTTLLAYVAAGMAFWWFARRRGMLVKGVAWVGAGAAVGAFLAAWIAEGFLTRGASSDMPIGSRTILFGLTGGWLSAISIRRILGIRSPIGDPFALALPLGEAVGRVGSHVKASYYGTVWNGPWAVLQGGELRHPVHLYASAACFGIFAILLVRAVWKSSGPKDELFKMYLLLFGLTHFALELVTVRDRLVWGMSPMQWFSLDCVGLGLVGLMKIRKRQRGIEPAVS